MAEGKYGKYVVNNPTAIWREESGHLYGFTSNPVPIGGGGEWGIYPIACHGVVDY